MRYQFASGQQQLPFATENVVVSVGGTTTAPYSLYFAILGENPAGFNLLSDIVGPIAIPAGNTITVTVPNTARKTGEFWQSYIIAASTTSTPSSFVQLGKIAAIDTFGDPIPLPLSLEFNQDEDFQISAQIATPDELPDTPLHGTLRAITSLSSKVFEYDSTSSLPFNSTTVLGAIEGAWVYKPGSFSVYVEDTTDGGGCDRPLSEIPSTLLRAPRYTPSGAAGKKRIFWILNNSSVEIESGLRIKLTFSLDDVPQGSDIDGLIAYRFLGYADINTGLLRTEDSDGNEFPNLNIEKDYKSGKTDLILPDDLAPNEAYSFEIYPRFQAIEAQGNISNGSVLKAAIDLYEYAGTYSEIGQALGNWIYPTDMRGWIVPDTGLKAIALKRSGMIAASSFLKVGPTPLYGLQVNTADQQVAINGDGATYLRVGALQASEALRAIVSTVAGDGKPCAWSLPITADSNQSLNIICNYPSNGSTATIRANYPDTAIAGVTGKARLNPPLVTIFIRADGEIRKFTGFAVLDGSNQTFLIDDWASGEVTELPDPDPNFSLFAPSSAVPTATGVGTIPAGEIEACFCFTYTGSTITAISHRESDGCVHEAKLNLAEMESAAQAWSTSVDPSEIVNIPQGAIAPWQTRRTTAGKIIIYNPISTDMENGTTVWMPAWKNTGDPGRWEAEDYQAQLLSGEEVPDDGIGNAGAVYLQVASPNLRIWRKNDPYTWTLISTIVAPTGAAGQSAYTNTTANFTQPAVNTSVSVLVAQGSWIVTGAIVFLETGGYYQVITPGASSIILKNLGYSGNATVDTSIPTNRKITAAGAVGATGSLSDADRLLLNLLSTPPDAVPGKLAVFAQDDRLKIRQPDGIVQQVAALDKSQVFTKSQAVETVLLASSPTVEIDATLSNNFDLLLDQAIVLGNPTGLVDGARYSFRLRTSSTYSLTFGDIWKWETDTVPDFATDSNRLWIIHCESDGTNLYCDRKGWFALPLIPFAHWMLNDLTYADSVGSNALIPFDYQDENSLDSGALAIVSGLFDSAVRMTVYIASGNNNSIPRLESPALNWASTEIWNDGEPGSLDYPKVRPWRVDLKFKAIVEPDGIQSKLMGIGGIPFNESMSFPSLGILYLSENTICLSVDSNTGTETLFSSVPFASNTWYTVSAEVSPTLIRLTINGSLDELVLEGVVVDAVRSESTIADSPTYYDRPIQFSMYTYGARFDYVASELILDDIKLFLS